LTCLALLLLLNRIKAKNAARMINNSMLDQSFLKGFRY
jgi:hypothetical protein